MTLEISCTAQVLNIEELQVPFDKIHKDVNELVTKLIENVIDKHNRATNISKFSLSVGDFVPVRRANERGRKLCFKLNASAT